MIEARAAGSRWPGIGRIIVIVGTLIALFWILLPIVWAVIGSLKTEADYRHQVVRVYAGSRAARRCQNPGGRGGRSGGSEKGAW